MPTEEDIDDMLHHYVIAALWSSIDEQPDGNGGPPMDDKYGAEDLEEQTEARMRIDCASFLATLERDGVDWEEEGEISRMGHDFWLTRNGHGCGFWDGDWPKYGNVLTELSKEYGEVYLYISDEKVWGDPPEPTGMQQLARAKEGANL